MFASSDGYRDVAPCIVDITLSTGHSCSGTIQRPRSKTLHEYLNNETKFVEVELFTGAVVQVAKSSIVTCEQRDVPRADQLSLAMRKSDAYHPFGTLGLSADTTKEQAREAYRARMRLYHGDRYATVDLPPEVLHYLDDMAKRVNAAYRDVMAMLSEPAPNPKAQQRRSA